MAVAMTRSTFFTCSLTFILKYLAFRLSQP